MLRRFANTRRIADWMWALMLIFASGEISARLDDFVFHDVALLANPDRTHDLLLKDGKTVRGRPGGRFKKYHLNSFGFRGPEMSKLPSKDKNRIMILGASESFGLYESPEHEYPAQLANLCPTVEIVNAAVAGMTLPTMRLYWQHWASQFGAEQVLIYPSPAFYLDNEPPATPSVRHLQPTAAPFISRFYARLRDTIRQSSLIRRVRVQWILRQEGAGKGDDWEFRDVPGDRLDLFGKDLESLCEDVQATGAEPILLTHAFKFPDPVRPEDQVELDAYRMVFPRATPAVIVKFEVRANEVIRELAKSRGWRLIELARPLNYERELFADPVHFTDLGARSMATLLCEEIQKW